MKTLLLPSALVLCAIPQFVSQSVESRSAPDAPVPQTFKWAKGDKPIKMIREREGFCFLSAVGGSFAGGGERVEIFVDDGWWWMKGTCLQPSLWARATCIRYGTLAPRPGPAPESATRRHRCLRRL